MRVYYLRLTENDFIPSGNVWTTNVIDLYDSANPDYDLATPSYTNFSTTKSAYGLNLLGDNTWTGMAIEDDSASPNVVTDSGFIRDGRFVDTTGRIDITTWSVEVSNYAATTYDASVSVYVNDKPNMLFPDEWSGLADIPESRGIFLSDTERYAKFQLKLDSELDISDASFEFTVRVRIDRPVMAPLYRRTQTALSKFPEWMAIREEDNDQPATPALATPNTLGGKFINAFAGEWLDDIFNDLTYVNLQRYIKSADVTQVAWVYMSVASPSVLVWVNGDGIELARSVDLDEFMSAGEDKDIFYWDEVEGVVYTRKLYTELLINNDRYSQILHHVWNWFDEHGLFVDLERHTAESNESYRERILDVYVNKPGVGMEAFKLALRRELNLWLLEGATPSSDYLGATPTVLEMEDILTDPEYINPDGMPKAKLTALIDRLAEKYPTTWGFFRWGEAYWDINGTEELGFGLLPYRYDADELPNEDTQSGVGDGNDLLVYRPDAVTGPREFDVSITVKGRERDTKVEYPEVHFDIELYGQADRKKFTNPKTETWVTFNLLMEDASTYYANMKVTISSDIDVNKATPTMASFTQIPIVEVDHVFSQFDWYSMATNEPVNGATPNYIYVMDEAGTLVDTLTVTWGRYDFDTDSIVDIPSDDVDMWLTDDMTQIDNSLTPGVLTSDLQASPALVLRSNEFHYDVVDWDTDHQPFRISVNGALPDVSLRPYEMEVPELLWDGYLETPPNKKLIVELKTLDENEYVAISEDAEGNDIYIPASQIYLNGSNAWVDGVMELPYTTTTLEFEVNSSSDPVYPINRDVWSLFEATYENAVPGVVDENGPWRNGRPPAPGSSNFNLATVELDRSDFGIPETDDYVLTWMGVSVNNDRVISWLDTNSIKPAVSDPMVATITQYQPNAIEEIYDEDITAYVFSPFIVRAKLRPEINPQWNPQVHSGWFYDHNSEYYMYVDPAEEQATANDWVIEGVPRQGAPIIVNANTATPTEFRQVSFFDTDYNQTLTHTQSVNGTNTNNLYLAFDNVYDVTVVNTSTGETVANNLSTTSNVLNVGTTTSTSHTFDVTYTLRNSYYVNHDNVVNGEQRSTFTFDQVPSPSTPYSIVYETSKFDPATPVDMPLNTFYTVMDEGFIYISHNEYDLARVEVRLDPSRIIADGKDYLMMSLRSIDSNGNPKPNQEFTLVTDFGTFEESGSDTIVLTTDRDGFAVCLLNSEEGATTEQGSIDITGGITATVTFDIDEPPVRPHRLIALASPDALPADGKSSVVVYGRVEDPQNRPVPYAYVSYRRGRSMYQLFTNTDATPWAGVDATPRWPDAGRVVADANGIFTLGPFVSATPNEPGYWFLSAESYEASPGFADPDQWQPVGDVVFWNEYPESRYGVNNMNLVPLEPINHATAIGFFPPPATVNAFPITLDEATPTADATPVTSIWEPPTWYAVDTYTQYQRGYVGDDHYVFKIERRHNVGIHPEYKDI